MEVASAVDAQPTAPEQPTADREPSDRAPAGRAPTDRRRLGSPFLVACGIVLVLYAVAALPARTTATSDVHRRQAAAFAAGHFDIRPVPASLRSLPDPYDAEANMAARFDDGVQDLAYDHGRLYSAHGLTVPLALLPFELLLGTAPPNWVVTLVCAAVGFLAGAAALLGLRRRFVPDAAPWVDAAVAVAFGLCSPVWLLLGAGGGYEAAIAASFACTTAGAALLLRSLRRPPRPGLASAVAGSTLLALAVGARPTAVVCAVAVAVAAVVAVRAAPDRHGRLGALAALVVPYVAVLGVLAWWNVARFGSPTEFGFGYQLSVWDMTRYPVYRASYLAPNVADYLVGVPDLHRSFPWVSLRPLLGGDRPDVHTAEPLVGVLFLAPVLLVGWAALAASLRTMRARAHGLAVTALTALATGVLGLVAVSLPFNTSTMRYAVDFTPMLLVAACIGWVWARAVATAPERRRLDVAWVVATCVGVAVAALVQMS